MARPRPTSLPHRLRATGWRRVGGLAAISLALSLGLVAYLFGWTDHFLSRLFTAFFVGFCLLVVTFLGVLPFISWAGRPLVWAGLGGGRGGPRAAGFGRAVPAGHWPRYHYHLTVLFTP